MSYLSPQPTELERHPAGLDGALTTLKEAIEGLGWTQGYTFLRAYEQRVVDTVTREVRIQPFVYMGGGEYYNALPNDNLPCTLFFRAAGPETIGVDKAARNSRNVQPLAERPLSLLFWGDLQKIGTDYKADYPYTELIKEEVIKALAPLSCIKSIGSYVDEPFSEVFSGYDLTDPNKHYNRFPYACFRLDLTVTYRVSC